MDYQETLATLATQDTGQRQTKHKKYNTIQITKKMSNTDTTKKPGSEPGEGQLVPATYKTPKILLVV